MSFEVKLVLTAELESPLDAVLRRGQCLARIAALQFLRRQDKTLLLDGRDRIQDRLEFLIVEFRQRNRLSRLFHRSGRDGENRLSRILDSVFREYGLVFDDRADVVLARDIAREANVDDARCRRYGLQVDVQQVCARLRTHAYREMQQAVRFRQIVGVDRCSRDVQVSTIVRQRPADG